MPEALFKMRWPQGFRCPKCGHAGYCEIRDRKVYQCHKCHFQASLIQGTIFAATKLPLTAWLLGIYLVTQSKDGISSLHLARTVGISANAALRMKHKLQQVMKDRDDATPWAAYFSWMMPIGVARSETAKEAEALPARCHLLPPCLSHKGHPLYLKLSHLSGFTLDEISSWTTKHLRPECLVISDGLNCFPGVTESQCEHEPIVTTPEGNMMTQGIRMAQHCYRKREKCPARHVSCSKQQTFASLSRRILLSFQPPVSTAHDGRSVNLCCLTNSTCPAAPSETG